MTGSFNERLCETKHAALERIITLSIDSLEREIKTRLDGMDKALGLRTHQLEAKLHAKIAVSGILMTAALILVQILLHFWK